MYFYKIRGRFESYPGMRFMNGTLDGCSKISKAIHWNCVNAS